MIPASSGPPTGGRFDFEDGGSYVGAWDDGKAHGHGICTGPKNHGEYAGLWQFGFEASGVYTWPTNHTYAGQWGAGKRNGLGVENKGRWIYRGEWTFGFKGRYGVRESTESGAKYEGTWTTGLQDGYGVETYADCGTYTGQWMRGTRHGYGVRRSAAFGVAAKYRNVHQRSASLTSLLPSHDDADKQLHERDKIMHDNRGGFVLTSFADSQLGSSSSATLGSASSRLGASNRSTSLDKQTGTVRKSLFRRLKKQKSTGDIALESQRNAVPGSLRSTGSGNLTYAVASTDSSLTLASKKSNSSFVHHDTAGEEHLDSSVVEIYLGEWKNDKRSGVGVCERSDGLKYEGEWYNNKKNGYGRTTFRDGRKDEGKYKNNALVASEKKHKLLLLRLSKLKERTDRAIHGAKQAAEIALQKAEIASARQQTARSCGEDAEKSAADARRNAELARYRAREYGLATSTGTSNVAGTSPGRSVSSSSGTAHAEVHPAYENKRSEAASSKPANSSVLTPAVLQDHFERFAAANTSKANHHAAKSPSTSGEGPESHPVAPLASEPGLLTSGPSAHSSHSDSSSLSSSAPPHSVPPASSQPSPPNPPGSPSVSAKFDAHDPAASPPYSPSSLVSTIQPKPFTRYSTVPAQNTAPAPSPSSNAPTPTTPSYLKHTGNHVGRANDSHLRFASQPRQNDSVHASSSMGPLPPPYTSTSPAISIYNSHTKLSPLATASASASGSTSANVSSPAPAQPTNPSNHTPSHNYVKSTTPVASPGNTHNYIKSNNASAASPGNTHNYIKSNNTNAASTNNAHNYIKSTTVASQNNTHSPRSASVTARITSPSASSTQMAPALQTTSVGNTVPNTTPLVTVTTTAMKATNSVGSTLNRLTPPSVPPVQSFAINTVAKTAPNNFTAPRLRRRGSLPDVSARASQQNADEELQKLKQEVIRRREQELAWRQTPIGLMVHRVNHTLEWCNRHTGFVVVLTVLSINFLFICIFLSYYNNSFGRKAHGTRDS